MIPGLKLSVVYPIPKREKVEIRNRPHYVIIIKCVSNPCKKLSLTSIELRTEFSLRPVDRPFLRYFKVSFFVLGVLDFVSFQH